MGIDEQVSAWELKGKGAAGGTVLKVVADTEGRLWLASPAGLFCRQDGAWRAVRRGVSFWRVTTVAASGRHLWLAGMPGGMIRSTNGGQTWHDCWIEQTDAPVVAIAPSPDFQRDRVLLAGTDGDGILRSTDGGRHWDLSNFGLREFAVLDVVLAPKAGRYEFAFAITENSFYQSPNGGRAWRLVEMGAIRPVALTLSPNFSDDRTLYLGTEDGELFVSCDAGLSWQLLADAFDGVNGLLFTPDGRLLVGTESDIQYLENGVKTVSTELQAPLLSLAAANDTLYAGLVDGLWLSTDQGRTWQADEALSARRMVWFGAQSADCWWMAGPEEGVWLSEDGGQTWTAVWENTPVLAVASDAQKLWVNTLDGLIVSADRGQTWGLAQEEEALVALAVLAGAVWIGNGQGQVWRQVDENWEAVEVPFAGQQLLGFLGDETVLFAAVWSATSQSCELWRFDGEAAWQLGFSQKAGAVLPQVAVSETDILVGLGMHVYRLTADGWRRERVGSVDRPVTALCALPTGGWLAAVTDNLLHSEDGKVWSALENNLPGEAVVSLQVVGDQLMAGTAEGKVWVS
ncbi:MAG: hypothetical protein H6651_23915 [Ardenticatenales bacterium]|nr:hypothetical protein [Ardenticatenales bacterium]